MNGPDRERSAAREGGRYGRRLGLFYAVLAIVVALAAAAVIAGSGSSKAQPVIAGGYDTTVGKSCLGEQFDIAQSGQFVSLSSAKADKVAGKLTFKDGVLDGDATCANGRTGPLVAKAGDRTLTGRVAGIPFSAALKRDPPPPGTAKPIVPSNIAGDYLLTPPSACVPTKISFDGPAHELEIVAGGKAIGKAVYADGTIKGTANCKVGAPAAIDGTAAGRNLDLHLMQPGQPPERLTAAKAREFGKTLGVFFLAVAVVMLIARLFGMLAVRVGQPRVMGEVVAGITLGPTILGAIAPKVQAALFPTDIIPALGIVANLGLIFYMFLVGLELDLSQLKGRLTQATAVSNASVALPMALGLTLAIPIYDLLAPPKRFAGFALFMGVAMSITAFPVLARILVERRMLKRPVGALVLGAAAVDDVTAWFLIALATAVATAGSGSAVLGTIALAVVFCLIMGFGTRPLLARMSTSYDEAGFIPGTWIVAIFAGVLLSAYATEAIGIALIFGAFVMGLVMPRHAGLTEDVTHRIEDFVVTLLLPLFFAYTGLRTNVGLLDRPELWLLTLAVFLVAVAGKMVGATAAARVTGAAWRPALAIGALMNTRGLTELIVLNLALDKGVISAGLFAMLVLMALATTFMAGPLLHAIDPENTFGEPVGTEMEEARDRTIADFPKLLLPDRSILVAAQSDDGLRRLLPFGERLAMAEPPRELMLARVVRPPRSAAARGALQTEKALVDATNRELEALRNDLISRGVPARAAAFVSMDAGGDLSKVAEREEIDLLLIDGARPLRGGGVPAGEVREVLEKASCDVAVLVARGQEDLVPGPGTGPIAVPFGGADYDWAALELAAWLAAATDAKLQIIACAVESEEQRVRTVLRDASALIRLYAGVEGDYKVVRPGREEVLDGVRGAGLQVVGLSERWRSEGLGMVRSAIASQAEAPTIFVRRGERPGALAPGGDVTRFTWSATSVVGAR